MTEPRTRDRTVLVALFGVQLVLLVWIVLWKAEIGSSDVIDVIANAAGGVAGVGLLAVVRRRLETRTAAIMTRASAIGTVILLVASAAFAAAPLHFAPPGRGTGPQRAIPMPESETTGGEPASQSER